jgi:DNA polymerase-1
MENKEPKARVARKKEKYVFVDGRNLLYRSYYSHLGLASKGKSTSAIFGFPTILKSIIHKLKPKKIYVVWDGHKSEKRMELLPDYKKRTKTRLGFDFEDFQRQEKVVRKQLKTLGISQVYMPNMEADDLIYYLVSHYKKKKMCYIVSSDKDFEQLLDSRVLIWNDKDNKLITKVNLKKHKGYKPHQVVDYLCLTGDASDNIPGYPGIGEKRAMDFLSKFPSIAHFLEDEDASYKGIDKTKLIPIYDRNLQLIDLEVHFKENYPDFDYREAFIKPEFDIAKFKEMALKYSMKSLTKKLFLKEFKSQYHRAHKKKLVKYENSTSHLNQ